MASHFMLIAWLVFTSLRLSSGSNAPKTALGAHEKPSSTAASPSCTRTTHYETKIITVTPTKSALAASHAPCGGTTVNAPNVNPIFWSAGIAEYFSRKGRCIMTKIGTYPSFSESLIGFSFSTNTPFTPPAGLGAAFTSIVTVTNPAASILAGAMTRVTDTAGPVATYEELPTFTPFNPSTIPITQVLTAGTGTDVVSYTVTSGTPVMVYTAIEIVASTYKDGRCSPITSRVALPTPVFNSYNDVSGTIAKWSNRTIHCDIPQKILTKIEAQFGKNKDWVAGTYKGLPTVNVAVYYTVQAFCVLPQYILTSVDALIASTTSSPSTVRPLAGTAVASTLVLPEPSSADLQPSAVSPNPPPVVTPTSSGGGLGGIIVSLFNPNPQITSTASNHIDGGALPLSSRSAVQTSQSIYRSFTLQEPPPPPYILTKASPTFIASSKTAPIANTNAWITGGSSFTTSDHTTSGRTSLDQGTVESSISYISPTASQELTTAEPLTTPPPVMSLGTARIAAGPDSDSVIAGETVAPGGPPVTGSRTLISVGPGASGAIVGSSTVTPVGSASTLSITPFQGRSVKSSTCNRLSMYAFGCMGVILMGAYA